MKSKASKITSLILVFSLVTILLISGIVNAGGFSDLSPKHWCYEKIMKFLDKDYICGYEDGTFRPDRIITRAEYVKIVNNFFGYSIDEGTPKANFSDVSDDDWFAGHVAEAVERGYITGYPDGTFKPQDPIRRQEATVILSRILDIDEEEYPENHKDGMAQYTDAEEIEDWAYVAIHSYSVYNFINGYPDGTIRLLQNVTRAETVELLNLLEEKIVIDRDDDDEPGGGTIVRYAFYYSDGEEIKDYRTRVLYGKTTLVKAMGLEKVSYYFDGWQLRGTEQVYQPGSSTEKMTQNLIFDAIWKPIYYDINYDANGGINAPNSESVRYNNSYIISGKVPENGELSFVGWKESGDTKIYIPKDNISNVLKDYNFIALWTELGVNVEPDENTIPSGDNQPGQEQETYELIANNLIMYVGEIEQLIAQLNPEHSATTYKWTIVRDNNENISLTEEGLIKALKETKKPVKINVTATTAEGIEIEKLIEVTVLDRKITIVTPEDDDTPENDSYIDVLTNGIELYIGEQKEMTLKVNPDAEVKEIKWSFAEKTKEAQIMGSNSGDKVVIEGLEKGKAEMEVTVTINGVEITKTVEVNVLPIEVTINHNFPDGEDDVKDYEETIYLNSKLDKIDLENKLDEYKYSGAKKNWYAEPIVEGESIINYESDVYETTLTYDRLVATISFNGNGATGGSMENQKIKVGAEEQLNKNTFTKGNNYEFKGWSKKSDGSGTIIKDEALYKPNNDSKVDLYAIWEWCPDVSATIVSNNYSNDVGKRAEPGKEIEYILTITNNEDEDLEIELSFGSDVTIVEPYEDVVPANSEIQVRVKKIVPNTHSIAVEQEEFNINGIVTFKNNEGDTTNEYPETSNLIEKSVSILSKEPVDKNIVIALDLSGSMEYCFQHEEFVLEYRYSPSVVGTTPEAVANFFCVETYKGIAMKLGADGYYHSKYAYRGHEYRALNSTEKWNVCTDQRSRLDVAKVALKQLLKDLFAASKANGETLNIQLVGFTDEAYPPQVLTESNYEGIVNALKAVYNTGMNDALNDSKDLIAKMNQTNPDAESYFMFFGDGLKTDGNVKVDFEAFKNSFDYIYPVGLGASFSEGATGYKSLKDFAKKEEDIIVALNSDQVLAAFKEITSKVLNSIQSIKGKVDIELEDGKYFPVVVTHEVAGSEVTLFEITSFTMEGDYISWIDNDTVVNTPVTAEVDSLMIDFTGTAFSDKNNLKVKLGSEESMVLPVSMFTALLQFENLEELEMSGDKEEQKGTSISGDKEEQKGTSVSGDKEESKGTSISGDKEEQKGTSISGDKEESKGTSISGDKEEPKETSTSGDEKSTDDNTSENTISPNKDLNINNRNTIFKNKKFINIHTKNNGISNQRIIYNNISETIGKKVLKKGRKTTIGD